MASHAGAVFFCLLLAESLAQYSQWHESTAGAISEVLNRRMVTQLFRLTKQGGDVTIEYPEPGGAWGKSTDTVRHDAAYYERLVMELDCQLVSLIEIHAWIQLWKRLKADFEPAFEKRLAQTLDINVTQVTVRVLHADGKESPARFSISVSIWPTDKDASSTWLVDSWELQTKISKSFFWLEGPHGKHDVAGEAKEAFHDIFGNRQEVQIWNVTQQSHTKPCDTDFHVVGMYKADVAHSSELYAKEHTPVTTLRQNVSRANITFDICSSPKGKFEAHVALDTSTEHKPMLANVTATVIAVDTRPYGAICPDISMRRTGHSVTHVGPYMVMFGGLAVLPGTDKAVPVSELWIMRQQADTKHFEWESLDRQHNIYTRPPARYGHVAAGTSDGLFIIFGGHSGKTYLHDLWAIRIEDGDIDDKALQQAVSFPPFRWQRCYSSVRQPKASLMMSGAVVAHGEQLVVFGGQDSHGRLSNEFWGLDLAALGTTAHWTQIWPYKVIGPSARFGHSMCSWPSRPWRALHRAGSPRDSFRGRADQGGILVFGGSELDYNSLVLRNDLWFFDLATSHWIPLDMGSAEVAGVGPGAQSRPPPLAFHAATGLGTAMVVIGGISVEVGLTATGYRFRVCNEIWRWMDEDGWSLQFTERGAVEAKPISMFRHIAVGAMAYWPEIGKLLLHGGQSDASAWKSWMHEVLRVQRSQEMQGAQQNALFAPTFFPAFLTHVHVDSIKSDVLLLEEEACLEMVSKGNACLPCSSGSEPGGAGATRDSHDQPYAERDAMPAQQLVPWIDKHAKRCIPCRAGTIFDRGRCVPCPAGFYGTFKGMQSWKMCWPCASDEYSLHPGSRSCTPCPVQFNESLFGSEEERSREEHVQQEAGRRDKTEDVTDFVSSGRSCPIFSQRPTETLNHPLVAESNQPHGDDSQEMHLWWQERALEVWACALASAFLGLLMYQARRPHSTSNLLRRADMRPITGQPVHSEAGGVVFIFYVVTCSCLAAVGIAHHLIYNAQLTSMSIPEQEESRSLGQIEVDLIVSATLVGYTGPCVSEEFSDGPWQRDSMGDAPEQGSDPSAEERKLGEQANHDRDFTWQAPNRPEGESSGMPHLHAGARDGADIWVQEEILASGTRGEAAWRRSFLRAPMWRREQSRGFLQSASLDMFPVKDMFPSISSWLRYLRSPPLDGRASVKEHTKRRLSEHHCHRLVTMSTTGLELSNQSSLVARCERLDNRKCRVSLTCPACSLQGQDARILLDVANGYAFTATREIHWKVETKWLLPEHSRHTIDAYSSVRSVVTTGDRNKCMRGPKASVVRITLVPTDYKDLLGSSHLYGFVAQFVEADQGSVTGPRYFHQQKEELHAIVELHASHSFYKLVLSKKRTTYDFLTQMLGFLSGMSLIARVTVAVWLNLDVRYRRGSFIRGLRQNAVVRLLSSVFCFWVPEEEDKETFFAKDAFDTAEPAERVELTAQLHNRNKGLREGGYAQIPQNGGELDSVRTDNMGSPARKTGNAADGLWRDDSDL